MTDTVETAPTSLRGHPTAVFWIVSLLALFWNGFGVFDYVMTNMRDPAYIEQFPAEMIAQIDEFPYWVMAAWALGVFGGLIGSLMLLMRSRFAVYGFMASILGLAGSSFYQVSVGIAFDPMMLVIWLVAILLLVLSIRWHRAGVLR